MKITIHSKYVKREGNVKREMVTTLPYMHVTHIKIGRNPNSCFRDTDHLKKIWYTYDLELNFLEKLPSNYTFAELLDAS